MNGILRRRPVKVDRRAGQTALAAAVCTAMDIFTERRTVRFQDVDAAGIVFYARVFDYFHDAYVAFLRARGVPLEDALRDGSWVAPLRHAQADYRRPLRFGDEVTVAIVGLDLEETEYRVEYRIETAAGVACDGATVHVTVDPTTFRRAPIPDRLRRALAPDAPDAADAGGAADAGDAGDGDARRPG